MAASIRKNFAFNFGRLLKAANVGQKQAAIDLGYTESRISKWMHAVNFPEDKAFDRIRQVYGWSYAKLVGDPPSAADELILASKNDVLMIATKIIRDAGLEVVKPRH